MYIPPPEPPVRSEYHHSHSNAESLHQQEHARKIRGGLISEMAVSLGLLFKLPFRLMALPVRFAARRWVRYSEKRATR